YPGKYTITLVAIGCGGNDTFSKTLYVNDLRSPKASFIVDNTNPATNDVVFFTATTQQCVDNYKWSFQWANGAGNFSYMNNTGSASADPQVVFADTGCWTVKLYVDNVAGVDSVVKTCYIYVKNPYCIPSAAVLVSDLTTSHVTLNTLDVDNIPNTTDYVNYVGKYSTRLEIGVTYPLTLERTSNKNKMTRSVWIDWNGDGVFSNSEKVAEEV